MWRRRTGAVAALAALFAALGGGLAEAANIEVTGTAVEYTAGLNEVNDVTVTYPGPAADGRNQIVVREDNPDVLTLVGAGCEVSPLGFVCTAPVLSGARVLLRDENDRFEVSSFGDPGDALPVNVFGGTGDDVLVGGPRGDTLDGDGGDDTITDYESRNRLDGDSGSDRINGRGTLIGATGDDFLDGSGTLRGGTGDDEVRGVGRLEGGRGNDRIIARRPAAGSNNTVLGESGADVLTGIARFDGGSGDDVISGSGLLRGGRGDDRLLGNRSTTDTFFGDSGKDTILARDGRAESIDCGSRRDVVEADANDRLTSCEVVET